MVHCKLQQSTEVFRSYFSGVLKISEHSLKTLQVACTNFPLPKNHGMLQNSPPESPKLTLLKLLLSTDSDRNYETLTTDVAARVLVSLVLKQFPSSLKIENASHELFNEEFEKIYITTNFESGLLLMQNCSTNVFEETCKFQVVDNELLEELQTLLCKLSSDLLDAKAGASMLWVIKNILTVVILYTNVISYLLLYLVHTESDLTQSPIYIGLDDTLNILSTKFCNFCNKLTGRRNMQDMVLMLKTFEKLFDINISSSSNTRFSYLLRKMMPIEILQEIFLLRNKEIENGEGKKN